MSRKAAREVAMRLVYQKDISSCYSIEALEDMIEEFKIDSNGTKYIDDIIYGVDNNNDRVDEYIRDHVKGWRFDRISKIDLAILRLAIYEIIWMEEIPYKVSINEAVELAKAYGSETSSSFINGVLGSLVRSRGLLGDDRK